MPDHFLCKKNSDGVDKEGQLNLYAILRPNLYKKCAYEDLGN